MPGHQRARSQVPTVATQEGRGPRTRPAGAGNAALTERLGLDGAQEAEAPRAQPEGPGETPDANDSAIALQQLAAMGWGADAGGAEGPQSTAAVSGFQERYGLQATGTLDAVTVDRIAEARAHAVTLTTLLAMVPAGDADHMAEWLPQLNASMWEAGCNSDARKAAYVAQLAHETDHFRTLEEYASGKAYEGRKDLGNTERGDGTRFKGRGAIQTTGRANYTSASEALGPDFVENPELLQDPRWAFAAAAHFWNTHDLNRYSDRGDIRGQTRVINGGTNGLRDREDKYSRATSVLAKRGRDAGLEVLDTDFVG